MINIYQYGMPYKFYCTQYFPIQTHILLSAKQATLGRLQFPRQGKKFFPVCNWLKFTSSKACLFNWTKSPKVSSRKFLGISWDKFIGFIISKYNKSCLGYRQDLDVTNIGVSRASPSSEGAIIIFSPISLQCQLSCYKRKTPYMYNYTGCPKKKQASSSIEDRKLNLRI